MARRLYRFGSPLMVPALAAGRRAVAGLRHRQRPRAGCMRSWRSSCWRSAITTVAGRCCALRAQYQPAQRALAPRLQRDGGAALHRHRRAGRGQAVLPGPRDAACELRGAAGAGCASRSSSMPACIRSRRRASRRRRCLVDTAAIAVGAAAQPLRLRLERGRLPAARRAAVHRRGAAGLEARMALLLALGVAALLSYSMEAMQNFVPRRVPSLTRLRC